MQQSFSRFNLVPARFVVEGGFCEVDKTVITLSAVRSFSVCPVCGTVFRRVHSCYQGRVTDLPLSDLPRSAHYDCSPFSLRRTLRPVRSSARADPQFGG